MDAGNFSRHQAKVVLRHPKRVPMISGSGSRPPSPKPVHLKKELVGKGARSQDDEPMNKYEGCLGFSSISILSSSV